MTHKPTALELDLIEHVATNETLHMMNESHRQWPWATIPMSVAAMRAHATFLRVTFGPEEAARLLYQLADEAADRVPSSSINTRIQKGT